VAYQLAAFEGVVDERVIAAAISQSEAKRPLMERMWAYYRNRLLPTRLSAAAGGTGKWYSQPQQAGLPARFGGRTGDALVDSRIAAAREAVIENDIGWRVQAMVDFVFGKPVLIKSTASDEQLRGLIERVLDRLWERSGGIALLQDFGTLGHVYGHVDLVLRMDDKALREAGEQLRGADPIEATEAILRAVDAMRIDVVEPTRGAPVLDERDYRQINAYVIRAALDRTPGASGTFAGWLGEIARTVVGVRSANTQHESGEVIEVISGDAWHVYDDGELVWSSEQLLTDGRVPVAHVQNISQPFEYGGVGEVEPLIPLQDELNTRLSDRAHRVALQSFKMYLAKGIEGFEKVPVGPGQVWYTDNMQASVESFGGDMASPSEESHVREVREALDKVSGVPPLSGGVVQGRIGNLTSANALRITLMGLLAKTARKRVSYGRGMAEMCELALIALHNAGVLATQESDRGVTLHWPQDDDANVRSAETKLRLGVPQERILAELGYGKADMGVN
jgi:hypothetical protein